MKLAFNGQGHYTDFSRGYEVYVNRSRKGNSYDKKTYNRIIRRYCEKLADILLENGIVDLPSEIGSLAAIRLTRRPQYRGKTFIGYGKMDWEAGHYDGKLKAFGITFLPRRKRNANLRSFGFVANRQLFKRVKSKYESTECNWQPIDFNDEMI